MIKVTGKDACDAYNEVRIGPDGPRPMEVDVSELFGNNKELLKQLIKALHLGADPDMLKGRFRTLLSEIGPAEITQAEQELIAEGMPADEIHQLCDVHLAVMREAVEKDKPAEGPGHPIYILLKEHMHMKEAAKDMGVVIATLEKASHMGAVAGEMIKLEALLRDFREYNKHKVREENCLFPYLEKHGVTGPPSIMWMEHDQQRAAVKGADEAMAQKDTLPFAQFKAAILPHLKTLAEGVPSHFYKEENILFPTAIQMMSAEEFKTIKASMDDLGYCYFTPPDAVGLRQEFEAQGGDGEITFPSGGFTREQLEAVLNTLPVDVTFVGADDTVRYFSMGKERIFPRTPAIIGRSVQLCHPEKSVHIVNKIVADFKAGRRELAEFWIPMNERMIHIRYFPVLGKGGEYLGTLEMTQDITDIQKITGQKRLLDD
jgi:DUF438 domain-containing protein